jgi:hypothetical protein
MTINPSDLQAVVDRLEASEDLSEGDFQTTNNTNEFFPISMRPAAQLSMLLMPTVFGDGWDDTSSNP